MAAWMLYATAVGASLSLAALLAESGLRRLGHPSGWFRTRWLWAGAMVATVAAPFVVGLTGPAAVLPGSTAGLPGSTAVLPGSTAVLPGSTAAGGLSWVADSLLFVAWVAVSLAILAHMRLSAWTVRRNARSWRRRWLDGRRVLVSAGFGPGVIGVHAPRIVVPEWAVAAESELGRLIVAHEDEHVRAGDTRLLLAAAVLVALVPWCLPLWWQLHRLRGAIETDCDARVLALTGDPRAYAEALVAVAGRRTRRGLPMPALSPGRGELERRIRWITARRRTAMRRAVPRLAVALLLAVAPAFLPAPDLPRPSLAHVTWTVESPWTDPPVREATVILSVEPEAVPAPAD